MLIRVSIQDHEIKLYLEEKGVIIDSSGFSEEKNMSEKLLLAIEALLQKNQILPRDIEKMELETDLGENFTTFRIARAIVETFNFAKNR